MNCTEIHGFSLVNFVSMAVAVLSNGKFLTLFLALHAAVQSFSGGVNAGFAATSWRCRSWAQTLSFSVTTAIQFALEPCRVKEPIFFWLVSLRVTIWYNYQSINIQFFIYFYFLLTVLWTAVKIEGSASFDKLSQMLVKRWVFA